MSVFRQSAIIYGLGWLLSVLQFLTSAAVARAVGPEGQGILLLLSGLTAIMSSLTNLGAATGAAVLYKRGSHTAGQLVGTVLALTAAALVFVGASYVFFSHGFLRLFLGEVKSFPVNPIWIALSLLPVLPSALLAVGDVLLIADDAMGLYALRSTGTAILGLLFTWLLAFGLRMNVTGVLLSQPLAMVYGVAVLFVWLARKGAIKTLRFSVGTLRDLLRIGLQQYALALVSLVAKRFDGFLIATLLSVREAGYYSIATTLQNIILNVPRATMWPLVSALSENDPSRRDVFARASRVQCALLAVAAAAFALIAPFFVRIVYGAPFVPAASPLRWVLIGVVAMPVIVSSNAYFTARGEPGQTILPAIVATAIQVGLNLALVPRFGVVASALALSLNNVIVALLQLVVVRARGEVSLRQMLVPTRGDVATIRSLAGALMARRAARGARPEPSLNREGSP
jgi:O-antigen/teichoic acid export membrane protein